MEGRDIGTVVLPNAFLKIFLTASLQTRAERRYKELMAMNLLGNQTVEAVMDVIQTCDQRDETRTLAPLIKPKDAIEIKTDGVGVETIVNMIANEFVAKLKAQKADADLKLFGF